MDLYDALPHDEWISSSELRELVRRRSKVAPHDHGGLDAEFASVLASGVVVGRVDEDGVWTYRRPGPPDPRTNLPGGENYNRGLQREHAANVRRLDAEEKALRAATPNAARVELFAAIDERLRELGLMPTAAAGFREVAGEAN